MLSSCAHDKGYIVIGPIFLPLGLPNACWRVAKFKAISQSAASALWRRLGLSQETASKIANRKWRGRLLTFKDALAWSDYPSIQSQRSLLSLLFDMINSAPPNLLQDFKEIPEPALREGAIACVGNLPHASDFSGSSDFCALLTEAAKVLRALDKILLQDAEDIFDEKPDVWKVEDGTVYIVPVARPVMREGGPKTGQSFSRRGLLHHRIIPVRVDDVDVVIEPHPDLAEGESAIGRTFGAAIFTDFDLSLKDTKPSMFVAQGTVCRDVIGTIIERQCIAARQNKCDTVLWPELSVTTAAAHDIHASLSRDPLTGVLPPLVVAGSWHVEAEGDHRNIAPVLDGRGAQLFCFGKSRKFATGGRTEDIVPYGKVHIVATDRELVAFAICKDFCDKESAVPVLSLDVDLVLVPSMGKSNTMTAHRDAADTMKVRHGARSVVVQQTYPRGEEDPPGYLLPGLSAPREAQPQSLRIDKEFTTFHLR